jgi:hypothetical protein
LIKFTLASYALAAAIALHKVCLYKKIGCSKVIFGMQLSFFFFCSMFYSGLIVRLLKLQLPSSTEDKDLPRVQRDADSIMKESASLNKNIPW